jgi:hypothetical protein
LGEAISLLALMMFNKNGIVLKLMETHLDLLGYFQKEKQING